MAKPLARGADTHRPLDRDPGQLPSQGHCPGHAPLAPTSPVRYLPIGTLKREHGDLQGLARTLNAHDIAFSQFFPKGLLAGGTVRACRRAYRACGRCLPSSFPPSTRTWSMPGLLRPRRSEARPLPPGQYHSAIAPDGASPGAGCPPHRRPLPRGCLRPARLSGPLGAGRPRAVRRRRAEWVQPRPELTRWARRGAFMHVMNHPKAFVLGTSPSASCARRAWSRPRWRSRTISGRIGSGRSVAGLSAHRGAVRHPWVLPVQDQSQGRGSSRCSTICRVSSPRASPLYDATSIAALHCSRVEAWLATPETVALFRGG